MVVNELSKQILSGKVEKDAVILVNVNAEGKVVFENIHIPEQNI
jgi:ATP-dependent Clp protease ATP-binding subunit ClpB